MSILLCLLFIQGCKDQASIDVTGGHSDDTMTWLSGSVPQLTIVCPDGIGTATLFANESSKTWPESIELVLMLSGLEGLTVRRGQAAHRLEVTASGQVLLEPPGTQAIKLIQHPGALQKNSQQKFFVLHLFPEQFADSSAVITLDWVDYYR